MTRRQIRLQRRRRSQAQHLPEPGRDLMSQLQQELLAGAWGTWPTWRSPWAVAEEDYLVVVEDSLEDMEALWGDVLRIQRHRKSA